jgi:hypothetical protein
MPLIETFGSSSAKAYGLNSFKPLGLPILTNLWGHYDASATNNVVDSTFVNQFTDQSGNGRHLTSTSNPRRPYVVSASKNGLNTLRFSGGQGQTTSSQTLDGPFTVFTVFKMYSMASYNSIWDGVNNNQGNFAANSDSGTQVGFFTNGWLFQMPASNNTWYRSTIVANSGGGQSLMYLNDSTPSTATEDGTPNFGGFRVGEGDGGGENANMEFAELVVYTGALSAPQRSEINQYLSAKWAI